MHALKVGHFTNNEAATGATVFLFAEPVVGAYLLCGSSPATRELNVLDLDANVTHVNGLVLLGGSAFGLSAVDGAMSWLKEQGHGWVVPHGIVPIIPAAAIYDLGVTTNLAPSADGVYQACVNAYENNIESGRIGAATGASVGKLVKDADKMSGGLGYASLNTQGIVVEVYAIVNPVGDVLSKEGKILAGACLPNGEFANCTEHLLSGQAEPKYTAGNTTLIAIFTNAHFTKPELKRISKMAVAGMGRAISPIFTRYDGDLIFSFSLGKERASEVVIGAIAAEAVQLAIINAVIDSKILK